MNEKFESRVIFLNRVVIEKSKIHVVGTMLLITIDILKFIHSLIYNKTIL
jgi:hypothetical protein